MRMIPWKALGKFLKRWVVDTGIAEKLGEKLVEKVNKRAEPKDKP